MAMMNWVYFLTCNDIESSCCCQTINISSLARNMDMVDA